MHELVRQVKQRGRYARLGGADGRNAADRVVQRSITFALGPRNSTRREGDAQCRLCVIEC
jgi:hypothetical protein